MNGVHRINESQRSALQLVHKAEAVSKSSGFDYVETIENAGEALANGELREADAQLELVDQGSENEQVLRLVREARQKIIVVEEGDSE